MKALAVDKPEALALIVGPVMALAFFLLEPGAMLIDSADSSDHAGKITALANNRMLSHFTGLMIPLGLLVTLYGMAGVWRATGGDRSTSAAVTRFGVQAVILGGFGWIIADGLIHILAGVDVGSEGAVRAAIPVNETGAGMTLMGSLAVSLGLFAFSLGLSARDDGGVHKIAALLIAVVSAVSVVALVIGHAGPNEGMVSLGRMCYFPWVLWSASLGVRFMREGGAA